MSEKETGLAEARALMVEKQLVARKITDSRILKAMATIPRHYFVEEKLWDLAYEDRPLPIGYEQTISQPYIVAFMSQALDLPANNQGTVLEIGTGSGYQTAILSQLAAKVYSVERVDGLATRARQILSELGIDNVEIKVGDGGYGWPEHAPYDAILVTAAAPEVPAPLLVQLKEGGTLISPVGARKQQALLRLRLQKDKILREKLVPVAFVPLLGEHGWAD